MKNKKKFEEEMKGLEAMTEEGESDLDDDEKDTLKQITEKKKLLIINEKPVLKSNNRPQIPRKYRVRKLEKVEEKLQSLGLDTTKLRARSLSRQKVRGRKRTRDDDTMADDQTDNNNTDNNNNDEKNKEKPSKLKSKSRERSKSKSSHSQSQSRERSKTPKPGDGYRSVKQKVAAEKLDRIMQRARNQDARKGEGDRRVLNLKPKWLFSGKRGKGSTDRR